MDSTAHKLMERKNNWKMTRGERMKKLTEQRND